MLVTKSIRKYLPVFLSISIFWLSWSQDGSRGSGGTSTRTNDSGTIRAPRGSAQPEGSERPVDRLEPGLDESLVGSRERPTPEEPPVRRQRGRMR